MHNEILLKFKDYVTKENKEKFIKDSLVQTEKPLIVTKEQFNLIPLHMIHEWEDYSHLCLLGNIEELNFIKNNFNIQYDYTDYIRIYILE